MAEQTYRYRAFISYRHVERDRKWARWLIEKLETFRTPRALVRNGAPLRIGQLFRDDDEIPASSDLSHQIEDALRTSQFLIVVCSRDTPQSKWVRHEIDFFRSNGGGSRIFALLVDGEPGEAFPPELLRLPEERTAPDGTKTIEWIETEPIAADVRTRPDERQSATKRRAFLRIAAGLLGVAFDDLAQREHQRRTRQRQLWGSIAAVLVLSIGAGGFEYWDYNRIKVDYFANFGTRWGVPFGIGELSSDAVRRRNFSYAVYTRRGRAIGMLRESSFGGPRPLSGDGVDSEAWDAEVAEWHISYEGDHVSSIVLNGPTGNTIRTESYHFLDDGESAVVTFLDSQGGAKPLSVGASELSATFESDGPSADRSQIGQHKLEFSPDGQLKRRYFQTPWGLPAQDANGSFARDYDYAPDGEIRSTRNLDRDGNPLTDAAGIASIRRSFSGAGDLNSAEWRDSHGALIENPLGYAILNIHRDNSGNDTEEDYLGTDRRPTLVSGGFARMTMKYDDHGDAIEETFFGTNGKPIVLKDKGFARLTDKFDESGNRIEESYFGRDGEPILCSDGGYARQSWRYDEHRNLIEQVFYGTNGYPIQTADGYARATWKWDQRGNNIEEEYFGADGKPALRTDSGYARATWAYDGRGNPVEGNFFTPNGNLIVRKDEGFARVTAKYDERGNVVEWNYFGADGKPMERAGYGFARETIKFDERGNVVERDDFGTDGKPILGNQFGYARLIATYDERGDWLGTNYFRTDGKPILHKEYGYASIALKYDEHGNRIEADYFGVDGKPVQNFETGSARDIMTYDDRGVLVKTQKYDVRGTIVP